MFGTSTLLLHLSAHFYYFTSLNHSFSWKVKCIQWTIKTECSFTASHNKKEDKTMHLLEYQNQWSGINFITPKRQIIISILLNIHRKTLLCFLYRAFVNRLRRKCDWKRKKFEMKSSERVTLLGFDCIYSTTTATENLLNVNKWKLLYGKSFSIHLISSGVRHVYVS